MQADYRVKEIFTDEETMDVIALCYDVLYGETFEKFIGNPDEFDGKENASNLLQDSNYEISDEIRADLEDIFGVSEFNAENDYEFGYQFYDFDDEYEDDEEMDAIATKLLAKKESFNLREALNQIDIDTYNKYDLLNLYESCGLNENEKRALANIVYDQEDPSVIYDTLNDRFISGEEIGMPERVKDGVIHESIYSNDEESTMTLVANDIVKFPNVISFKATFDDGELKGHTWSFVKADANGEEFIRSIGGDPDDTPVAFLTVNGREGGYFTSTKDFASGEYKSIKEDLGDKTFSQWFDETQHYGDDDEFYPFSNYIKKFPNAEILKDATAEDIRNYAHRFYSVYDVDSVDREKAFHFASEELGIDYDALYDAWIYERPIGNAMDESFLQDIHKDHMAIKSEYGQEVYDALDTYVDNGKDLGDVLYKESEWNKFVDWAKNEKGINIKPNVFEESVEEEPYTKEMIEQDLKTITNNFTEKEGELKCGFKEEKEFGVEILKQHYKVVEVSGDDRREGTWYHISYAEPIIKEDLETSDDVDTTLTNAEIGDIIVVKKSLGGKVRTTTFEKIEDDKWDVINSSGKRMSSPESNKTLKDKFLDGNKWKLKK